MAEIEVRPALLRAIGNSCENDVAPVIGRAETVFDDASSLDGLGLGELLSAGPLKNCYTGWRGTFREGTAAMHSLSDKIRATAAVVDAADQNIADLYRGHVPEMPPIAVNIGGI